MQDIIINNDVTIRVLRISGDRVKLAIIADPSVPVWRGEIHNDRLRELSEYRPDRGSCGTDDGGKD